MADNSPTSTASSPNADPVPPAPLRLHVTSDTANLAPVRRSVEAYARATGFDDASVADIGLVLNEAMANVIRHAYGNQGNRPIEVEAEPVPADAGGSPNAADGQPIALRIRLRDWGNGLDPRLTAKRGYTPGEPGGLGLVCLRQMMDHVEWAPQPDGGVLLTMIKKARRGEPS